VDAPPINVAGHGSALAWSVEFESGVTMLIGQATRL
jgi:hypothetical protein